MINRELIKGEKQSRVEVQAKSVRVLVLIASSGSTPSYVGCMALRKSKHFVYTNTLGNLPSNICYDTIEGYATTAANIVPLQLLDLHVTYI